MPLRLLALSALSLASLVACSQPAACRSGDCVCPLGAICETECAAPPCSIDCAGDNPHCSGACANGDCTCGTGSDCDLRCDAPPCHASCEDGSTCTAECANGDCTCGRGSRCAFECNAGPCHVTCDGDNEICSGVCSNGTCSCGPDSGCEFTCDAGPCHTECAAGSTCLVRCPNGNAGTQDCDILSCAAGEPVVCPDGMATVCGVPCP